MKAFRLLALGYALLALLIAPAWLTADERSLGGVADGALEQTTSAAEPVLDAVTPGPTEQARDEQEAPPAEREPAVDPPVATAEKADGRERDSARSGGARPAADKAGGEPRQREKPVAKAAQSASVTITDFEFTPATVTVDVGDTVTWTNDGPTVHTATAEDGSFDTGNLDQGESGSATFNQAGTISYICTPHPFMRGRVVVRAAGAGSPGGGGPSGGGATTTDDDVASSGTATSSAGGGRFGLPATGFEALMIGLLGLATLAAGTLLRRAAA